MTKKNRVILIGAIGGTCLLLVAGFRSCIVAVVNPKPWKVGTISIPEKKMEISLFFGSMQSGLIEPYNGVYRALELAQPGKPPIYIEIPPLGTMDRCRLEAYWYPTNSLIRFKDTALGGGSGWYMSEFILDLNSNILSAVIRSDGVTKVAKLSRPMQELTFQGASGGHRFGYSASSWTSTDATTGRTTRGSEEAIGREVFEPIDAPWAKDPGKLVGVLAP